jgi:hypothetical protein
LTRAVRCCTSTPPPRSCSTALLADGQAAAAAAARRRFGITEDAARADVARLLMELLNRKLVRWV